MFALIMPRGSLEVSTTTLVKTGFVLITITVQSIHGTYLQESGSGGSLPTYCTSNSSVSIVDVSSPSQEITINLRSDFKYLQTSMIIGSCYFYSIFRGNRFLTGQVLNVSHSETGVPMMLSHTSVEGIHAYRITIETDIINFTDVINTSTKCGKFQGYRIKAVGATLCTLSEQKKEGLQDTIPEMSRSLTQHEVRDIGGERRPQVSTDEDDDDDHYDEDKVAINTIRELHQWVNGAYVMAICFVLTVYALFLLAKMCQIGGVIHEILHARDKATSLTPADVA